MLKFAILLVNSLPRDDLVSQSMKEMKIAESLEYSLAILKKPMKGFVLENTTRISSPV